MRAWVVAGLASVLAGCFGLVKPRTVAPTLEVKRLIEAPQPVTTPPDAITMVDGRDDLPRGFFYYVDRAGGQPRYKLFAVPGYPTAAAAHRVIAGMALAPGTPVYAVARDALVAEYKKTASGLGATAVFVPEDGPQGLAFAIAIGDGAPPASTQTAGALIASHKADVRGYQPLGAPLAVELTDATWSLDTREAHCYAAVIALEPDAALGPDAQRALYLALESSDGLLGNRSYGGPREPIANPDGLPIEAPQHGRFVAMRSYAAELGCARGTARARLRLWTRGDVTAIGTGALRVAMYERVITKRELAALVKEADAAREEARLAAEQQRRDDEARAAERERERAERDAARAQAARTEPTSGGASSFYSMSLKNECPRTVKLFIGDKPRWGSGTSTSIGANTITSYSGSAPVTYWIVDDRGEGVSAYTAHPGSQRVRILPTCSGMVAD